MKDLKDFPQVTQLLKEFYPEITELDLTQASNLLNYFEPLADLLTTNGVSLKIVSSPNLFYRQTSHIHYQYCITTIDQTIQSQTYSYQETAVVSGLIMSLVVLEHKLFIKNFVD